MPPQPRRGSTVRVQGVESLAGEILLRDATANLDPRLARLVEAQLGGLLPGRLVPAGEPLAERVVRRDDVLRLARSAVVTAVGLAPETTPDPPPPVLWELAGNRLLVHIAGVGVNLDEGLLELTLPVSCDQTGDTQITVAFVTESGELPTGGMCLAEDRPRGPAVVVDAWHEQLIALAWHTVVTLTGALSGLIGADASGQRLVSRRVSLSREGLAVTPMARHSFAQAADQR